MVHERGQRSQGFVHDLDRVGASGHFDDRHGGVQGVFEMVAEFLRIDGRRGDDELQVTAFGQQCGQVAEQEIDVEAAFMRLVDHDGVVAA